MKLSYRNRKLEKLCCTYAVMVRELGQRQADRLAQRMGELVACPSLAELGRMPGPRLHELAGDREGQLSVDLVFPYRLIVEPAVDPVPRTRDGGLRLGKIDQIRILEIADTH